MGARKKILHVEDNLENRVLIRRLLMSENYEVLEAENARQAMDILRVNNAQYDPHGYQYARYRRLFINR